MTKNVSVELAEGSVDYGSKDGTSNALILVPKTKKRKKSSKDTAGRPNVDAKKREAKRRRLATIAAKQTKSHLKKLAKIVERKQKKESREELFESLQQYQLSTSSMQILASTSQMQTKEKKLKFEKALEFSGKLNSVSGRDICHSTIHNKAPEQEDYYETDSDSGSDSESDEATNMENNASLATRSEGVGIGNEDTGKENTNEESPNIEVDIKIEPEQTDENTVQNAEDGNDDDLDGTNPVTEMDPKNPEKGPKLVKTVNEYMQRIRGDHHPKGLQEGRKYVPVTRTKQIEAQRCKLPIFAEEQSIVEAINENMCVIISGETGSGKTTQLPQFLYEAGYSSQGQMIGITEPRRVAAISMATRVADEMNLQDGTVAYQIRYEGNRSPQTKILFMTDGVLMKELQKDVMLSAYSVIIIDEAHERSMYSDVLIGLLSRIAPLRAQSNTPLKLIIMSATLRISDFTQKLLFPVETPRILRVDSRQYPVTVHFERRTPENYLQAAFRKVCRIHETLPSGTILIFLSGRLEVEALLKWLIVRYPLKRKGKQLPISHRNDKYMRSKKKMLKNVTLEDYEEKVNEERNSALDDVDNVDDFEMDDLMDSQEQIDDGILLDAPPADVMPLYCLPLYSLLSSEKQRKVFEPIPDGCRLCVIATNVAETSLTIPGVRYVVDSGYEKRRIYDPVTGVSQFVVHRISQASADQRAGRAGRVQAGHVYRLYSSAIFADSEKFSAPEILNKPIDQLVLHMKSMNIVKVANFPFPTRPDKDALEEAEKRLIRLGALQIGIKNSVKEARISQLGKTLSMFPLAPKFAKILVMANQNDLLPYACTLVAILSVREPLIPIYSLRGETNEETQTKMLEALKQRRAWCSPGQSRRFGDLAVLLKAILACFAEKSSQEVCERNGVRPKALNEIGKLRQQLTNLINSTCHLKKTLAIDPLLKPPTDSQLRMLRQIVIASLSENIARRIDRSVGTEEIPKGAYESQNLKDYLFIDASSVLYKDEPEWVLFQEIVQINEKKCMQNVMIVEAEWLAWLAMPYCEFSDVKDAEPIYNSQEDQIEVTNKCTFGDRKWQLADVNRPLPANILLYRHFARFFLDGKICGKLGEYADKLLLPPTAMTKPWAKLQRRTERLLNALIEYEVTSRSRLLEVWKTRSEYLLDEYLEWLPQCYHDSIQLAWPPLEQQHHQNKIPHKL